MNYLPIVLTLIGFHVSIDFLGITENRKVFFFVFSRVDLIIVFVILGYEDHLFIRSIFFNA